MALSESGVRLVAENSEGFNRAIDRAQKAVDDFGARAGGAGASGLERMSAATVALGVALGNLAAQAINAAAGALTNFVSAGFEYNKTLENAEAQLLAFTGSQEEADLRVKNLLDLGTSRGYLTYEELNTKLPDEVVSPDKLDSLLMMIDEMGIRLIDESDIADFVAKPKRGSLKSVAIVASRRSCGVR